MAQVESNPQSNTEKEAPTGPVTCHYKGSFMRQSKDRVITLLSGDKILGCLVTIVLIIMIGAVITVILVGYQILIKNYY